MRVGRNYPNLARLPKHVQFKMAAFDVVLFETNFFRIAGTLVEASVSEKAECSLAIGEDRNISSLE